MDDDLDLLDFDGVCRLFPLPGVVLFPHAVLPLHIFEPRYRQMTEDALDSDRLIAIVQIRDDVDWDGEGEPPIADVACLGKILKHERLADGRFNVLLQGRKRARIIREIDVPTLYRQARVDLLDDLEPLADPAEDTELLVGLFREVASRVEGLSPEMSSILGAGLPLGVLTDLVAQSLGIPGGLKQAFLDDRVVERRARGLTSLLRQVVGHLKSESQASRSFPPPFSQN